MQLKLLVPRLIPPLVAWGYWAMPLRGTEPVFIPFVAANEDVA